MPIKSLQKFHWALLTEPREWGLGPKVRMEVTSFEHSPPEGMKTTSHCGQPSTTQGVKDRDKPETRSTQIPKAADSYCCKLLPGPKEVLWWSQEIPAAGGTLQSCFHSKPKR